MHPILLAVYLILCIMVGLFGRSSRLGFFRSFFFSVLLTPFLVTLVLLIISTLDVNPKGRPQSADANKLKP